jgi:protein-tyrosine phosphatase
VKTSGEVFPYIDNVQTYLEAGEGAKVSEHYQEVNSQWAPVEIEWEWTTTGARKFRVEYATKKDFSDALSVEVGATKRKAELYNLYKSTTYYVRVSALNGKGEAIETQEGEFYTTDLGPRFMKVDEVYNVRDLGGYETADGHTLAQGIAYRGGHLLPPKGYTNRITEEGLEYMSEVMGIKSEIDFRTSGEAGFEGGSYIPGATLNYITINGYNHTFDYDDEYYQFFSMLADEDNYPVYMHCTGGADRTGSAVFLLHTMLGVSDLECLQGYELTSYSIYGLRDTKLETVNSKENVYKTYWENFMAKLDSYAGNTRQEKVETWMKTVVGISQEQIDKIKSIFYGETVIEGKTFLSNDEELPLVPFSVNKSISKQCTDMVAAWAVQKKKI